MVKGVCSFLLLMSGLLPAAQAYAFPELTGLVVDEADILSDEQERELAKELAKASPYQVVAVSLLSTDGQSVDDYACKLHDYWQLTNTVMILFAPAQKRLGVHLSHDLNRQLIKGPNQIVGRVMIPLATKRQYDAVMIEGAKAIVADLNQQAGRYQDHAVNNTVEQKTLVNDTPKQAVSPQKESFLPPKQKKRMLTFLEPVINFILAPFGAQVHGIDNMNWDDWKNVFLLMIPAFLLYPFRRKSEPKRQQKAIVKRED